MLISQWGAWSPVAEELGGTFRAPGILTRPVLVSADCAYSQQRQEAVVSLMCKLCLLTMLFKNSSAMFETYSSLVLFLIRDVS